MTETPFLAVRLSRRAIGVAVLLDEEFVFWDSRHLTSNKHRVERVVDRYVRRILEQSRPASVVLYAPRTPTGTTGRLREVVLESASAAHVPVREVEKPDVLRAFGAGHRTSKELQETMRGLWMGPATSEGRLAPLIAEAGGAALYGDSLEALDTASPS